MTTTPPDEDTIHGRLFADLLQLSALVFTTAKTYATPDLEKQLYIP